MHIPFSEGTRLLYRISRAMELLRDRSLSRIGQFVGADLRERLARLVRLFPCLLQLLAGSVRRHCKRHVWPGVLAQHAGHVLRHIKSGILEYLVHLLRVALVRRLGEVYPLLAVVQELERGVDVVRKLFLRRAVHAVLLDVLILLVRGDRVVVRVFRGSRLLVVVLPRLVGALRLGVKVDLGVRQVCRLRLFDRLGVRQIRLGRRYLALQRLHLLGLAGGVLRGLAEVVVFVLELAEILLLGLDFDLGLVPFASFVGDVLLRRVLLLLRAVVFVHLLDALLLLDLRGCGLVDSILSRISEIALVLGLRGRFGYFLVNLGLGVTDNIGRRVASVAAVVVIRRPERDRRESDRQDSQKTCSFFP